MDKKIRRYKYISRFHRVSCPKDRAQNTPKGDEGKYRSYIEYVTISEGLYDDDVSIVNSIDEMPESARNAYLAGSQKSGFLQPSMFFKPTDEVYLIAPSIQMSSECIGLDLKDFILVTSLCSVVVYKEVQNYWENKLGHYEKGMSNMFSAIGKNRILNKRTIGGGTIGKLYEDQIKLTSSPLDIHDKTLLSELYFVSTLNNVIEGKNKPKKMYIKFAEFASYWLGLPPTDSQIERLIGAAWNHRR